MGENNKPRFLLHLYFNYTMDSKPYVEPKDSSDKADIFHIEDDHLSDTNNEYDAIEETEPGKRVWWICMTASVGGFLFGYDTGVISAVLVSLGTALGGKALTSGEQELITSITSGGAFIGALVAGLTGDKMGRKFAIYLGCVVFILGAIIQAAAYSLVQMTIGRLIVGFGVGSAAMIIPLYIGELAPARYRGRLIVFDNLFVAGGQFIADALELDSRKSLRDGDIWLDLVPCLQLFSLLFCHFVPSLQDIWYRTRKSTKRRKSCIRYFLKPHPKWSKARSSSFSFPLKSRLVCFLTEASGGNSSSCSAFPQMLVHFSLLAQSWLSLNSVASTHSCTTLRPCSLLLDSTNQSQSLS